MARTVSLYTLYAVLVLAVNSSTDPHREVFEVRRFVNISTPELIEVPHLSYRTLYAGD